MGADCDVRFDSHPDKIVYAGQQVSGIVDINVHNLLKVRSKYLANILNATLTDKNVSFKMQLAYQFFE